jgi:hypothetical protein
MCWHLFTWGATATVVAPDSLRTFMAETTITVAQHYTGTAFATNFLASAGALPSHSVAVPPPKPITTVDRSGKADRLTPRAPLVNIVLPRGCESSVSIVTRALAVRSRMAVRHLIRKDKLLPSSIGLQAQNVSTDFSPLFGGKGECRHFRREAS